MKQVIFSYDIIEFMIRGGGGPLTANELIAISEILKLRKLTTVLIIVILHGNDSLVKKKPISTSEFL